MLEGTPLQYWKARHEEEPTSAVKEGWIHPGDTQVLKSLEGACQETITTRAPWTATSPSQAVQTGRP